MLVIGFPAGPLQANCYLLAPTGGAQCIVVDPGQESAPAIGKQVGERGLTVTGVLATHGHFDHVFSAAQVCRDHDVPLWIHPADRFMLSDPGAALGPQGRELFGDAGALDEPPTVHEIADQDVLDVAGLHITVRHTPSHTAGSVVFGVRTDEGGQLLLSGDTLFAGSIGRTDLPGGDHEHILRSLATVLLPLDDDTVVLPGHGPTTTIGRERTGNPFLHELRPPAE